MTICEINVLVLVMVQNNVPFCLYYYYSENFPPTDDSPVPYLNEVRLVLPDRRGVSHLCFLVYAFCRTFNDNHVLEEIRTQERTDTEFVSKTMRDQLCV